MTQHRIGVATADVTPPVGTFLAGYAARLEPSDGVYHPLRAVCVALDDGGGPGMLVSIEWLGLYDRTQEARERIAARTGIAPARILLSGTHTHCGPVLRRGIDGRRHGGIDEEYIERSLDALADAADRALADRRPARLRAGTGWCGIAASRRRPDGRGGVLFKPSRDAPHDPSVSVLAVESPDGALRHLLYSYACHPTSGGAVLQVGGDYVAFAGDRIEAARPGSVAAFFQGCAGDQKVDARDAAGDGYRALALEEVRAAGEKLADAVLRVVDAGDLHPVEGEIAWNRETIELRTDASTEEELKEYLGAQQQYLADWARHQLERAAAGTPVETRFPFEVQTLRVGSDLALVGLAGEMSVEYALRFRRELGGAYRSVWTLGYANEMVGYVPARRQIPEGGYEVVGNNRHLLYSGPFAADTEEKIAAAVHRALG